MKNVTIFSDGACSGNPGPGGWASVLLCEGKEKLISGSCPNTTNNRMEITAVLEALKILKYPCCVEVVTDSAYVVNTMTKGWKRNKNNDLWSELDKYVYGIHEVRFTWIKGHSTNEYNNLCDKVAVSEYGKYKKNK